MANRIPLSQWEKERIFTGKLAGSTLPELAQELKCSLETVRKWWRRGRKSGVDGLRPLRPGRRASGILSQFDPQVAAQAKVYKEKYHGWGPNRVLIELRKDPRLQGLALPGRSRLATFFKVHLPECVAHYHAHPPAPPQGSSIQRVHAVWQMDSQEEVHLAQGGLAIICNIRDPYGAAPIASQAFCGQGQQRSRKLTVAEYRQVLRAGFTEWRTLPESVWTDNELRLIGNPASDFPSLLTLYLAGLGIRHVFIRPGTPTDHAQVERGHRTLDNWVFSEADLQDVAHLQQALDRERQVYLLEYPCQASDCQGRPPLIAHPELLHPVRDYHPDLEPLLFSLQRVYDYLATFVFERKISTSGCVALTCQVSIGREFARQIQDRLVWIRCDPQTREWVIYQKPTDPKGEWVELVRRPIQNLDYETLTGLDPQQPLPPQPVQLPLLFPVKV